MTRALFILGILFSTAIAAQDISDDSWKTYKPADGSEQPVVEMAVDTPDTIVFTPTEVPKLPGKVTINEDPAISELVKAYDSKRHTLKGYRVQVFLGDRDAANKVRGQFQARYPGTPVYLSYLAPNFRVRVGDLRDRAEAEALRYKLKNSYSGAYIVPDEIEWPGLK